MPEILFHFSQALIVIAFILTDILWLRVVSMVALSSYLGAAALLSNKHMLVWGGIFAGINFIRLLRLAIERRPKAMNDFKCTLYKEFFKDMTQIEFIHFWDQGKKQVFKDRCICREGEPQNFLYLIVRGMVIIKKGDHPITTLDRGYFLAEMSFLTGRVGTADVLANGEVEVLKWSRDLLRHIQLEEPKLFAKILSVIGVDLIRKLKEETQIICWQLRA